MLGGSMFTSYPAVNHLEAKLEQQAEGTHMELRHSAIGLIDRTPGGRDQRLEAQHGGNRPVRNPRK